MSDKARNVDLPKQAYARWQAAQVHAAAVAAA